MSAPNQLLFCLPSAGGGASIYASWSAILAPGVRVRPVALPGREKLIGVPPLSDCESLIARLVPDVAAQIDRPYAIFGHSMGALVGFELACALRDAGHAEPTCLIVSGYPAPQRGMERPPVHDQSDDRILDVVRTFGGVPDDLLHNREYLEFMLPLMRADLAVLENYRYTARPPLTCPVIAIGGQDDTVCRPEHLEGWHDLTTGRFTQQLFAGGHFHLFEQREPFHDFLRQTFATRPMA